MVVFYPLRPAVGVTPPPNPTIDTLNPHTKFSSSYLGEGREGVYLYNSGQHETFIIPHSSARDRAHCQRVRRRGVDGEK